MTVKTCIRSMRLRTLPLCLSGVSLGICAAASRMTVCIATVCFLLLTACLLQILSNLSNELGDSLSGTDMAVDRNGKHYPVMDGEMSIKELKCLVAVAAVCCAFSGLVMVWLSFGTLWAGEPLCFILLGACAIASALRYTLGRNPYGYRGFGGLFVFLFFGLVSTIGSYMICAHPFAFPTALLLPASAVGCFSTGVLNVNNIRDMATDARTRVTVALRLGAHGARIYQSLLILTGWILLGMYLYLSGESWYRFLFVITLPLYAVHLCGVWHRESKDLDSMLPLLVMSTFITCLIAGITLLF